MKRHESLQELSRDHFFALVQAKDLKEIGMAGNHKKSIDIIEKFIDFWTNELQNHFREEEEILFPVFTVYEKNSDEIIQLLLEHLEIRSKIYDLNCSLEVGILPEIEFLNKLGNLLHDHIRFEEREFFPLAEQKIPEKVLFKLSKLFAKRPDRKG
jgi:hemerythrin-like domain-containing protein